MTSEVLKLAEPESVGISRVGLARLDAHLDNYVASGRLAGCSVLVARAGEIVHHSALGLADRDEGMPVGPDTIYRIYSMSKPVTSVAVMQLYEGGLLQLDDPVAKYIPSWADIRVYDGGEHPLVQTREPERAMTIRDLLSHQSGLGYGRASDESPVDYAYRAMEVLNLADSLEHMVEKLATLPLLYSPGERWRYSIATDVCGYLVQVISGQPFDEYLNEHVFRPLGMVDTGFWVAPSDCSRFAANYGHMLDDPLTRIEDPDGNSYTSKPAMLSGGGGLVSTAIDYWRFAQALCNGGELEGQRIIGRKTLELMVSNHLPGGTDLASIALGRYSETTYQGIGFGLGFSVTLDPVRTQVTGTPGEYSWGGAASTTFLVDPAEELVFVFLTQLMPSWTYNLRRELRAVLYGCLE